MIHFFDEKIAVKYGVEEAIFIQFVIFWVRKNKANNKNKFEGKYWTYNSFPALTKLFPYWSSATLKRVVKSCISQGIILKGNFNKRKYDRTNWYTVANGKLLEIKSKNLQTID